MLFRLPNGLAVEPVLIRKKFLKWQDAHPEFPRIVFHGLRHSSATYQLMISGGDVKAVQGTTGHATADMLVNTYAHIQQSSRVPAPPPDRWADGTAYRCHGSVSDLSSRLPLTDSATSSIPLSVRRS